MDKEIEINHKTQSATLRPNLQESHEGKPGILSQEVTAKTKNDKQDFDSFGNPNGQDEKNGNGL